MKGISHALPQVALCVFAVSMLLYPASVYYYDFIRRTPGLTAEDHYWAGSVSLESAIYLMLPHAMMVPSLFLRHSNAVNFVLIVFSIFSLYLSINALLFSWGLPPQGGIVRGYIYEVFAGFGLGLTGLVAGLVTYGAVKKRRELHVA